MDLSVLVTNISALFDASTALADLGNLTTDILSAF